MSIQLPVNAMVDALRERILRIWPEVTRVPEGLSPEDFAPGYLPMACIVKHPTVISQGKPAAKYVNADTSFDIFYVAAQPAVPGSVADQCREKCLLFMQDFLNDSHLLLQALGASAKAIATRLDDTPQNPAMQLILHQRWPLTACAVRIECMWTERIE